MARILIAEDERDIRELINLTLMFAGHEMHLCANGAELVEKAPVVKPDLILTDVRMPKLTGYEACKAIKSDPTTSHIPVVMLTAKGQDEELQMGKEAGAFAYILKPFAPDELTRRVAEILQEVKSAPPAAEASAVEADAAPSAPPAAETPAPQAAEVPATEAEQKDSTT